MIYDWLCYLAIVAGVGVAIGAAICLKKFTAAESNKELPEIRYVGQTSVDAFGFAIVATFLTAVLVLGVGLIGYGTLMRPHDNRVNEHRKQQLTAIAQGLGLTLQHVQLSQTSEHLVELRRGDCVLHGNWTYDTINRGRYIFDMTKNGVHSFINKETLPRLISECHNN